MTNEIPAALERRNPPASAEEMRDALGHARTVVREMSSRDDVGYAVVQIWTGALAPQWLVRLVFPTLARYLDDLTRAHRWTAK